jgi:hypothetical protein
MRRFALIGALLALCGPAHADDATDMAAAANRFYATLAALPRQGGLPGTAARARLAPLLSPRLGGMIDRAVAADARFHATIKDSPPLFEGDLFSSQFEGFQTYKVGACSGSATAGRCSVQLHYQQAPGGAKAAPPVDWNDDIVLVKTGGAWRVDDIAYKGAFAFGNSGLASETLKMVISTAP